MGYIYKITNDVNNKIYVGKTELADPYKRWKEHLQDYKKQRCEKRPLYAAMNKHGIEHFHFEVIEETDNTCEREQYWINKLRTYVGFKDCNGYNATLGGDGKSYLNLNEDEVIRYYIEEACYLTDRTARHFDVNNKTINNILKKHNITTLGKSSSRRMQNYVDYGGVFQISVMSKNIINVFESASDASNHIGEKVVDNIARACRAKNNSHYAYGYLWYYGKDLRKAIDNNEIKDIII